MCRLPSCKNFNVNLSHYPRIIHFGLCSLRHCLWHELSEKKLFIENFRHYYNVFNWIVSCDSFKPLWHSKNDFNWTYMIFLKNYLFQRCLSFSALKEDVYYEGTVIILQLQFSWTAIAKILPYRERYSENKMKWCCIKQENGNTDMYS